MRLELQKREKDRSAATQTVSESACLYQEWKRGTDLAKMEFAAIFALSLLIGALVVLVAVAVGRQKSELSEQNEQKKDTSAPGKCVCVCVSLSHTHTPASNLNFEVDFFTLT